MKKHKLLTFGLYNQDGMNNVNKHLEDGWLIKEIQTTSDNETSYSVVWLEKKDKEENE
ncbi:MAG: hypothetical protein FWB93_02270 [Oscillospiraceae bacterium]|nr:hypothetical protein [Oscillospiraceae bacterium]